MTAPVFGFSFRREAIEPAPPSDAIMSIVGICGPMTKAATVTTPAFEAAFPLDTPVLINSTDAKARMIEPLSAVGDAISGINSQLGRMQRSARIVMVRVAEDDDADATKKFWNTVSNIIGNSAAGTGIWAFKRSGAIAGCYPRLVCVPGYTSQRPNGVDQITIGNPGSGYVAPTVSAADTYGSGFVGKVNIDENGAITSVDVIAPGNYTQAPSLSFSDAQGTNGAATCTLAEQANPIRTTLVSVLNSYLGVAVVDGPATSWSDAIDDREDIQSDRIIIVEPDVNVLESGVIVRRPASPRVIGIAVRRDFEYEGRPSHSWANQPIYGITSPGRYIDFSLTDGATEGQDLLDRNLGVIVRGESGDDFAIADGGFVFVGTDNCDEASAGIWQQYHKVRMRDFIELTTLRTLRAYLGRFNLTTHTIQAIVNTVSDILNIAQAKGDILGYLCRFDRDENNPDDLRAGHIYIDARFEEAPVFRRATVLSRPHRPALDETIAALTASTVLV